MANSTSLDRMTKNLVRGSDDILGTRNDYPRPCIWHNSGMRF